MKITNLILTSLISLLVITTYAETNSEKDSLNANQFASKQPTEKLFKDNSNEELRHLEFGVRYMPTFSSINVHTHDGGVIDGSVTMSHGFGIMTALNLNKHIGIQAEANYYQITQKYSDRSFTSIGVLFICIGFVVFIAPIAFSILSSLSKMSSKGFSIV